MSLLQRLSLLADLLGIIGFGALVATTGDETVRLICAGLGALCLGGLVGWWLGRRSGGDPDLNRSFAYQSFLAAMVPGLADGVGTRSLSEIIKEPFLVKARGIIERQRRFGDGVNVSAAVFVQDGQAGSWSVLASDGVAQAVAGGTIVPAGDLSTLRHGTESIVAVADVGKELRNASSSSHQHIRHLQENFGANSLILVPVTSRGGRVAVLGLMGTRAGMLQAPESQLALLLAEFIGVVWNQKVP